MAIRVSGCYRVKGKGIEHKNVKGHKELEYWTVIILTLKLCRMMVVSTKCRKTMNKIPES